MYHYTDGGLRNVWLNNGYVERDTPYGKAVSFHDLDGLITAICIALVKKPARLTGAEFRYLRNALLLSQKSLGKMVGYTEQAVAKWEKSGKIPKVIDVMMRALYDNKNNGDASVGSMIEMLNTIDRLGSTKIIVTETDDRWLSTVELAHNDNSYALAA